ncbi:MAG: PAS domain S-box protein [Bacteroidales bacterium]|nr:PAS domain S-box protein [Bacteroidales bacterium]
MPERKHSNDFQNLLNRFVIIRNKISSDLTDSEVNQQVVKELVGFENELHRLADKQRTIDQNAGLSALTAINSAGTSLTNREIAPPKDDNRLRESEERYRLLSDITFEGIGLHNMGVVVDVNNAFVDMFGYSRDELLNVNALGLIIPERHQQMVLKHIKDEYNKPYLVEGRKKDGSEFPMEIESRNYNYNGQRLRVTAFRDLTYKSKVELALKSALKLNQLQNKVSTTELIELALEEAMSATQSGIGFFCLLEAGEKQLSVTRFSMLKGEKKLANVSFNWNPIETEWYEKVSGGMPFVGNSFNAPCPYAAGEKAVFSNLVLIPISENNQTKAIFGVANASRKYNKGDIDQLFLLGENLWLVNKNKNTEEALTESENKFSYIARNINDIIWTSDIYGNFTYFSPSALKWLGYSQDEVKSLNIISILHPEVRQGYAQQLDERLKMELAGTRSDDVNVIVPLITKNGTVVPSEIKASPLYDKDGRYIGMAGITRDVTMRVQSENKLKESEKQLKDAVAAKDRFLSIIAHDLKSPFSAIIGLSDVLLEMHDKINNESRAEIIRSIHNSTSRTFKLLENLLSWSSVHTGRKVVEPVKFTLENKIKEGIELFGDLSKRKEINVVFRHKQKTEVWADIDMFDTVLRNLLSNAFKYTFSRGVIEVTALPLDATFIEVSVRDTGIGISDENLGKLFRIDSDFSTPGLENEKGTGLGLILCKEFVEKNGGKIMAESIFGKGSVFSFTLPLAL